MKASGSGDALAALGTNVKDEVFLEWKDVNLSVLERNSAKSQFLRPVMERKRILSDVNGCAASGQLLAIMGPTGCGKTSLLNVLAGRVPTGRGMVRAELKGKVLVNNKPREDVSFRRVSAYVLQDDRLYPHLTVHETLSLASNFFLPSSMSAEKKSDLVDAIILELNLAAARNTIIGDEKVRGVSGGERKRANIAVQLISNPKVLFMDEPTSGLDSFQAQSVMEAMKNVAANGRLVISVVHQPRSSIFKMFDNLLLLSMGRTMYFGKANAASMYFAERCGLKCPPLFNPSDYFLDILSPDFRSSEQESRTIKQIKQIGAFWEGNEQRKRIAAMKDGRVYNQTDLVPDVPTCCEEFDLSRLVRNFRLLCWRAAMEQTREIPTLVTKFAVTVVFGLIVGGIFQNLGHKQADIMNRVGLLFVIGINQGFNAVSGVLNIFPKEKLIVSRERAANAYDTLSYFSAKFLVEMPINVAPCIVFGAIVYHMVGLSPGRFGYFLLILVIEALTCVSLGLVVSAAAPNVEIAQNLGPLPLIIALIFGGFFINLASLPYSIADWLPYLSFLKWVFESLCVNEFTDITFECDLTPASKCQHTGKEVLEMLTFTDSLKTSIFGLTMLFVAFLVLAFIVLDRNYQTFITMGHKGKLFDEDAPLQK